MVSERGGGRMEKEMPNRSSDGRTKGGKAEARVEEISLFSVCEFDRRVTENSCMCVSRPMRLPCVSPPERDGGVTRTDRDHTHTHDGSHWSTCSTPYLQR